MTSLLDIVTLLALLLYAGSLLVAQIRGGRARPGRPWLVGVVLAALLATAARLIPADAVPGLTPGFFTAVALALQLTLFGILVIRDVAGRTPRGWPTLGAVWVLALVGTTLASPVVTLGQPNWLSLLLNDPDLPSLVMIGGLIALTVLLYSVMFRAFYRARLPEVANRALFWVIITTILVTGTLLMLSGSPVLVLLGTLTNLVGVMGAAYAQISQRVIDIRGEIGSGLRALLLLALTSGLIFAALTLVDRLDAETADIRQLLLLALAIGTAAVLLPLRGLANVVGRRFINAMRIDPAEVTRRYSQDVSRVVELEQLAEVAGRTLSQTLRVRRATVIVVNDPGPGRHMVELLVPPTAEFKDLPDSRGVISKDTNVYRRLMNEQLPLLQFDLEFNPQYADLPDDERDFFKTLRLSAYAPIIMDGALIGLLASGAKMSDAPFFAHDLELLATLANQTVVALRGARLVNELRTLNDNMRALNTGLEETKEQLERLDSVKTDFVTIASHELRTPLAQMRGYTDIIDALAEQGNIDENQLAGLVNNLRRATERMEELITNMLDVSQLDVNAMDLHFAQISLDSAVRMAIEPLSDAIRQRKLSVSARKLKEMPMIQGDLQRLVQAFRNLILNAIKFTPDGGRIDIRAELKSAKGIGDKDYVLLSITDTGVGIANSNLELIFTKFYRTYNPSNHSTGTYKFMGAGPGLGLTIAKGVIEGHGGKIWAESPGHSMETLPGSTFFVLLPVTPPVDARRVLPFEGQLPESVSTEPTLVRADMQF